MIKRKWYSVLKDLWGVIAVVLSLVSIFLFPVYMSMDNDVFKALPFYSVVISGLFATIGLMYWCFIVYASIVGFGFLVKVFFGRLWGHIKSK